MLPAVVVPVYQPSAKHLGNLRSIASVFPRVLVFVNQCDDEIRPLLDDIGAKASVDVVFSSENLGVAGAYRYLATIIDTRKYPFTLLLDQDSELAAPSVSVIDEALSAEDSSSKTLVLIPTHFDLRTGIEYPVKVRTRDSWEKVLPSQLQGEHNIIVGMGSGCIFSTELFQRIICQVPKNMWLDGVDVALFFLAERAGGKFRPIQGIRLGHALGEHIIDGRPYHPTWRVLSIGDSVGTLFFNRRMLGPSSRSHLLTISGKFLMRELVSVKSVKRAHIFLLGLAMGFLVSYLAKSKTSCIRYRLLQGVARLLSRQTNALTRTTPSLTAIPNCVALKELGRKIQWDSCFEKKSSLTRQKVS